MQDIITYDSLLCPTTQLEDALRNIFCKFRCGASDTVSAYFDPLTHTLTVTINGQTATTTVISTDTQQIGTHGTTINISNGNTIDLTALVKLAETNTSLGLQGNTLTFTNEDGLVTNLNLCPVVKACETVTAVTNNTNGTSTYTNEVGTQVSWKRGGISTDAGNALSNGSDGLPFAPGSQVQVATTITNTVSGHKIADYTNEVGTVKAINETISTITVNASSIATYTNEAGQAISFPVGGISGNPSNGLTLGSDGKPFLKQLFPVTDSFIVNSGASVTITSAPDTSRLVQVFRGGLRVLQGTGYSVSGLIYTFTPAFGVTSGGAGSETITIDYYKN